jgi:hypothetical protein
VPDTAVENGVLRVRDRETACFEEVHAAHLTQKMVKAFQGRFIEDTWSKVKAKPRPESAASSTKKTMPRPEATASASSTKKTMLRLEAAASSTRKAVPRPEKSAKSKTAVTKANANSK